MQIFNSANEANTVAADGGGGRKRRGGGSTEDDIIQRMNRVWDNECEERNIQKEILALKYLFFLLILFSFFCHIIYKYMSINNQIKVSYRPLLPTIMALITQQIILNQWVQMVFEFTHFKMRKNLSYSCGNLKNNRQSKSIDVCIELRWQKEAKQLLQPQNMSATPLPRLLALHWSALTLDTQCTGGCSSLQQSHKLIQQVMLR